MERTIYAHLKLVPTSFPDKITVQCRVADPENNQWTGEAYEFEDTWDHIRATFLIREADLDEREEYLKEGDAANFGFQYISGEFPSV